jgi:hypothetical protein
MLLDFRRHLAIRWPDGQPAHVALLRQAAIDAVVADAPAAEFAGACAAAGIEVIRTADAAHPVIHPGGLWPGVAQPPNVRGQDDETASASREPWVDANSYRIAWLRALAPARPAVLGYQPDAQAGVREDRLVAMDTLELALIEAWAAGGNDLLALAPAWRQALQAGEASARSSWMRLGRTARWLKRNRELFGHPVLPGVTLLVEHGERHLRRTR